MFKAIISITTVLGLATTTALGLTLRPDAESYQVRNLNTVKAIYNLTVYPNNLAFLRNGTSVVPRNLFSDHVVGRVTPIGDFVGLDDSLEYFFALTPEPAPPTYTTWTDIKVTHFVSDCPEVAASVIYGSTTGVNSSVTSTYQKPVTTLKQVAFWHFDASGAVDAFDAWLPTLQQWWDKAHDTAHYPVDNKAVINQLCGATMKLCTSDPQWSSATECVTELSKKPMGTFDNVWGDNVWCRALHVRLTPLRPQVHCDHVGPTGGGKCTNTDYNVAYFDDQALFGTTDKFNCPQQYGTAPPRLS